MAAIAFAGGCSSSSSESNSPDGGMQSPDGGMQSPDGGMQSPDGGTQTPTFSLSPNPVKQTVANGHSANVSLTVSRDGAQGDIALSVTGSALLATTPGDGSITYAFNPNPESGSGTSVLTFTVGATVPAGDYPLTIAGALGGETETAAFTLTVSAPHELLLVDDDGSSNNSGSDTNLSVSDTLFRDLLDGAHIGYDVQVVPTDGNGPTAAQLHDYFRVIWYTGNAYGGDFGTLSSTDQLSLESFLDQQGAKLILFSPEFAYDVSDDWTDNSSNDFLSHYVGALGGVENPDDGNGNGLNETTFSVAGVSGTSTSGDMYRIVGDNPLHNYLSTINPAPGTDTLLTVQADPDDSGTARAVACITGKMDAGAAHQSKVVYVGITLENLFESDSTNANKQALFEQLLDY